MRFKFNFGLAAIAMTCLAISALAQQPGQPGQRGDRGRGGGGPPGGGGGGGFTSRLSLLRIAEIRKELELADEQVAAIETLDEELRAKYPLGRGGPGGPGGGPGGQPGGDRGRRGGNNNNEGALQTVPVQWYFVQQNQPPGQPGQPGQGRGRGGPPQMTPEEQAAMEKQRAERDREASAKLADILLPHQVKRLNEIYVQQAGAAALQDEEIAKLLGISDAQKAKLAEVNQQNRDASSAAMREMFQGGGGGGGDRDAIRAKFDEMRKANEAKVLAVLSADQQKKFEDMKGKAFAMPEGRGGPGGPGGRGGPGGPGGGRGPGGNTRPGGNNN